jgi:hypothetical protein
MDLVALNASTLTPPNSRIVSGTVFEIMADCGKSGPSPDAGAGAARPW